MTKAWDSEDWWTAKKCHVRTNCYISLTEKNAIWGSFVIFQTVIYGDIYIYIHYKTTKKPLLWWDSRSFSTCHGHFSNNLDCFLHLSSTRHRSGMTNFASHNVSSCGLAGHLSSCSKVFSWLLVASFSGGLEYNFHKDNQTYIYIYYTHIYIYNHTYLWVNSRHTIMS